MFFKYCRSLLLIISLFLVHLVAINFLPVPINKINLIFLFLLWQIIYKNKLLIGYSLIFASLLELFSSTPFGVNLVIYPASLLIIYWFSKNILTNRSFFTIIIITALGTVIFKLIFYFSLVILNIFIPSLFALNQEIFILAGWEVLFNSLFSAIIYLINYNILKNLNPTFLKINKRF